MDHESGALTNELSTFHCIYSFVANVIFSDAAEGGKAGASSDEEETETPQEKKLRLAKQYLAELEKEGIILM